MTDEEIYGRLARAVRTGEKRVLVVCPTARQAERVMRKMRDLVPEIQMEFGLRDGQIDLAAEIPKAIRSKRRFLR